MTAPQGADPAVPKTETEPYQSQARHMAQRIATTKRSSVDTPDRHRQNKTDITALVRYPG